MNTGGKVTSHKGHHTRQCPLCCVRHTESRPNVPSFPQSWGFLRWRGHRWEPHQLFKRSRLDAPNSGSQESRSCCCIWLFIGGADMPQHWAVTSRKSDGTSPPRLSWETGSVPWCWLITPNLPGSHSSSPNCLYCNNTPWTSWHTPRNIYICWVEEVPILVSLLKTCFVCTANGFLKSMCKVLDGIK